MRRRATAFSFRVLDRGRAQQAEAAVHGAQRLGRPGVRRRHGVGGTRVDPIGQGPWDEEDLEGRQFDAYLRKSLKIDAFRHTIGALLAKPHEVAFA